MVAAWPAGEELALGRGRAAERWETPAAGTAQAERQHVANCSCCSRAIVDHEPLYMRKDEIYCSGACRNMAAHVIGPAELHAEREERAQRARAQVRGRQAEEARGPPRHPSRDGACKGDHGGSRKKFWKRLLVSVIDIVYSVISGRMMRRGAGLLGKNLGYGAGDAASPGGRLALKDVEECRPKASTSAMLRSRTSPNLSSQRCDWNARRLRADSGGQRPARAPPTSRPSSPH